MTIVIFRRDTDGGEIVAFFPDIPANSGYATCYTPVGQHSSYSRSYFLDNTQPATPIEYAGLEAELRSIGYNDLKICKRHPPLVYGQPLR